MLQLKTIPDYSKLSIDDAMKYRGSEAQSEDRARKHDHAASIYNHVSSLPMLAGYHHYVQEGKTMM